MKNLIVVLCLFFLSTISYSQKIGVNTLLFDNGWSSFGYGGLVEYDFQLNDNFDLTTQISVLYNTADTPINDKKYFNIPIMIGVKYFVLQSSIKPFVSVELVGSYFDHDYLTYDSHTGYNILNESGMYFGGSGSVGTYIKLSELIDLNVNVRLGIISERYADYFSYNLGLMYSL